MFSNTFRGGVHPQGCKEYARDAALRVYEPKGDCVFPVSQHIGKPAKVLVKKGDPVLVGQLIAEADGYVSANVHSSVSGTVKAVEKRLTVAGAMVDSIVVENDGNYTTVQDYGTETDYTKLSNKDILFKIREAGIVGMGGAGFPTPVKLEPKNADEIEYVIVNGAECEPYITCDDRMMREHAEEIVTGLKICMRLFPNADGRILIEDNKPEAIEAMKKAVGEDPKIRVVAAPTKYPQGGERSIIAVITGRYTKVSQLPAEAGCIVDNVGTIYAIYEAVCKNIPLIKRAVTVTGPAVKEPCNLITRIGVSQAELVEAAGGLKEGVEAKKVISGGPMMGIAMSTLDVPLQKANNALTLLVEDEAETSAMQLTSCIHCGRCDKSCPMGLIPQMMSVCAEKKNYEDYENRFYGLECIQCGSCTFVCPAKRPLMQLFKQAKAEILANKRAEAAKEAAKKAFEEKQAAEEAARKEQEKAEQEALLQKKRREDEEQARKLAEGSNAKKKEEK